jgi:hypothetical protein
LSVSLVDTTVAVLAPALAIEVSDLAGKRLPGLHVSADSPLPVEPAWHAGTEHGELAEELEGFLASHDLRSSRPELRQQLKKEIASQLPVTHPWQRWLAGGCPLLLNPDAVRAVGTAATQALLTAGQRGWPALADEGDNSSSSMYGRDALPVGAPQGLARALQCRRRVFALERELVARENSERGRESFDRLEQRKNETRLMEVNRQLEEKLRVRTEELRRAGQKIIEAQRSVDDARTQLAQRKREIEQLKYQVGQDAELRQENLAREQELKRSMLRCAARESVMQERAKKRADRLQNCLQDTGGAADLVREAAPDEELSSKLIDKIEAEFAVRLRRRKEQYEEALRDFDRQIEVKRSEHKDVCKKLRECNIAYSRASERWDE